VWPEKYSFGQSHIYDAAWGASNKGVTVSFVSDQSGAVIVEHAVGFTPAYPKRAY
jgi:hypothetical protein